MAYDSEPSDSSEAPKSTEDKEELVEEIRKCWKTAKDGLANWRTEAREDYAFRDGDQWDEADLSALRAQNRPALTFNRVQTMVEAVSGLEINNRQEVKYYPREIGDVGVNEVLTESSKWVRSQCNAENEDSEAFKDAATCGIGCTETLTSYEENPDGAILIVRKDPITMYWEPSAKRSCLYDAKYVFNAEWMDKKDIEARWPDSEVSWSEDEDASATPQHREQFAYTGEDDSPSDEVLVDKAMVLHYQCWKLETYYRLSDPQSGKPVEFTKAKFKTLRASAKKQGVEFVKPKDVKGPNQIAFIEFEKKVYYRAFLVGATLLEYGKLPVQYGFTFKFITAKRDRNKNQWYGVVRVLKDPQRWANKWLSQILHIINTNSKGGVFFEEGAFANERKAEEQWGSTEAPLIKLTEGGLSRIKERGVAQYPTGLDRLMHFSFEMMPFVSGLNLEILGLAGREQAGVLEAQRRKAAVAILAPLFNALSAYRKDQGLLLLQYINEYISDGRLVRIVGDNGTARYIPLVKQGDTAQYDVVIGEAPASPDFRERVWESLGNVIPHLIKQGVPIPAEVLAYSPLPLDVSQKLQQAMQSVNQVPPQVQAKMKEMEGAIQKLGQENGSLKEENTQMRLDHSTEVMKLQVKQADGTERNAVKREQIQTEAAIRQFEALLDESTRKFEAMLNDHTKKTTAMIDSATKVKVAREKPKSAPQVN